MPWTPNNRHTRIRLINPNKPNSILSNRLKTTFYVLVAFVCLLIVRTVDIAVFKHEQFAELALILQTERMHIAAGRGNIYDRYGEVISWNINATSIYAVPDEISSAGRTSEQLSVSCDVSQALIVDRLQGRSMFCWIDRAVSDEEFRRVRSLELDGVYFINEQQRGYRSGNNWSYLIGNVDIDGKGIGGAELAFDKYLRAEKSSVRINRDRQGRKFALHKDYLSGIKGGYNAVLTIDANLQDILTTKLKEGVRELGAKGAYGVFLEVGTSEVLAMGQYYTGDVSPTRNVVISDMHEPGSTFKLIPIAAAINSGKYSAIDIIDCENGRYAVGGKVITDHHKLGKVELRRAVELSSNIAMVKLAAELGSDLLYKTAVDFGMEAKTGIELPGESAGVIHDPDGWSDLERATFAFGNGLTTTALQMANAYAAVGAGGKLYRPYILKAVTSAEGEIIIQNEPRELRRVISARTAATLMEFFTGVVDSGTAVLAKIDGLKIAGKTGTSRKTKINGRGYDRNRFLSSFVGLYPADDPVIVGYIVFDEPTVKKMASVTAVPAFREILMEYLCSPKRINRPESNGSEDPDAILHLVSSEGNRQGETPDDSEMLVSINDFDELNRLMVGKPVRTAVRLLHLKGYEVIIEGAGLVKECYPVNKKNHIKYYLKCG